MLQRNTLEYKNLHARIMRARGRAMLFKCIDCGFWAEEWSHVHNTDQMDYLNYEPRCRSCHAKYDLTDKTRERLTNIGKLNGNAKLNFQIASEIRQKYLTNKYSHRDLATLYGVSRSHIARILHNKLWTNGQN